MDGNITPERERVKNHRLYFGRKVRFVDNNGNLYPEAFVVVDSQTDVINKQFTMRSIYYKSTDSFEYGEPPISKVDGGIVEAVYRAEYWDKYMVANGALVAQVAMTIHRAFDAIHDVPRGDGSYESRFVAASEIIVPE